ncbi:hypothetical protein CVT24_011488 [Panaeolus cyanescens]|uniref:Uncharacterized protein n=1 Tax=Panaeolus cyanescens TaxID=181874 RepID=A0A409WQI4_9AGAR|nr:hypothetical protein CVT24_011488 [Panaeolus cyanescens]
MYMFQHDPVPQPDPPHAYFDGNVEMNAPPEGWYTEYTYAVQHPTVYDNFDMANAAQLIHSQNHQVFNGPAYEGHARQAIIFAKYSNFDVCSVAFPPTTICTLSPISSPLLAMSLETGIEDMESDIPSDSVPALMNDESTQNLDDSDLLDDAQLNATLREAMDAVAPSYSRFRLVPTSGSQKAGNNGKKRSQPAKRAAPASTPPRRSKRNKTAGTEEPSRELNNRQSECLQTDDARRLTQPLKKKKISLTTCLDSDSSHGGQSSEDDEVEVLDGKKRKRKGKEKAQDKEEDPEIEIIAYIYVERAISKVPARSASGSRPHKPTDDEKYAAYGVITFSSTDTYDDLLSQLATHLPCPRPYLLKDKIMWKFRTPANSVYLSLGGKLGFESLIKQLRARKPDNRIIFLSMPPPVKPMVEEPHWPTVSEENTAELGKQSFDYDALELTSTEEHVAQQKMSFDKSVGSHMNELLDKYPMNNNPLYPDMRVYHDVKMNAYFDLTDTRLKLWASHLARKTATVDRPPVSKFFDYNSRITKPPPAPAPPAATTIPAAPPLPAQPSTTTTNTTSSLIELMVLGMIQQQQQQFQRYPIATPLDTLNPVAPAPAATPAPAAPLANLTNSARSQPQSPANFQIPDISLGAFCERYGISGRDQERLEKLEYQPGDKLDALEESDWKNFAGFTSLSWQRILEKTRQFVQDVRNGLWV